LSTVAKTGQIVTQLATQVQSAPTAFSSKMASSCALENSLNFSLQGGKTTNCQKGEKNKELQRQARGT
jgi:hypothetical protein